MITWDERNSEIQECIDKFGYIKMVVEDEVNGGERPWAVIANQESKDAYDSDANNVTITVYLLNHLLSCLPNPTWGAKISVQLNGENIPSIDINDLFDQMNEAVANGMYPIETDK